MKRFNILACAGAASLALASLASAAQFAGNGATGFGGPLGQGSLEITNTASTVTFTFTPGPNGGGGFNGNDVVIYVDSKAGGLTDTSTLTDVADEGRRVVSGLSNTGRPLVSFAAGFDADYGLFIQPGYFGAFDITGSASNFTFVNGSNQPGNGLGPFSTTYTFAELGITPNTSFDFVATLISGTGFRSNETIGTAANVPGDSGTAPNVGDSGTTTFSDFRTYNLVVPEPTTLAVLAGAGLVALRRRK